VDLAAGGLDLLSGTFAGSSDDIELVSLDSSAGDTLVTGFTWVVAGRPALVSGFVCVVAGRPAVVLAVTEGVGVVPGAAGLLFAAVLAAGADLGGWVDDGFSEELSSLEPEEEDDVVSFSFLTGVLVASFTTGLFLTGLSVREESDVDADEILGFTS